MTASHPLRAGARVVDISRPQKELFPGVTKLDLASYYVAVARRMIPLTKDRPVSMERYPDGIGAQKLFQQHIPKYFPDWIARATVTKRGGTVEHILANDAPTLAYLASQAAITIHTWLSDTSDLEHPDQIVLDLDPTGCEWRVIKGVAVRVRELLEHVGLPAYLKASGSRGLHVVVPLDRSADFDEARAFADRVAQVLAAADPDTITLEARKAKRGGCLFFDTGRNAYAQTAVAPYSVRARECAPVAVPLAWDELPKLRSADQFKIGAVAKRVEAGIDPWNDLKRRRCSLRRAWPRLQKLSA